MFMIIPTLPDINIREPWTSGSTLKRYIYLNPKTRSKIRPLNLKQKHPKPKPYTLNTRFFIASALQGVLCAALELLAEPEPPRNDKEIYVGAGTCNTC